MLLQVHAVLQGTGSVNTTLHSGRLNNIGQEHHVSIYRYLNPGFKRQPTYTASGSVLFLLSSHPKIQGTLMPSHVGFNPYVWGGWNTYTLD